MHGWAPCVAGKGEGEEANEEEKGEGEGEVGKGEGGGEGEGGEKKDRWILETRCQTKICPINDFSNRDAMVLNLFPSLVQSYSEFL